jgi:hypothetical protein
MYTFNSSSLFLNPSVYFNSYHKERENIPKRFLPPPPQNSPSLSFFLFVLLVVFGVGYWKLNRKSSMTFCGHCDSTGDTRDKYTQDGISSAKMYPQTTRKFRGEDTGTFISEGNTYDRCSDLSCFVVLFVPFHFFLVRGAFVPLFNF